METKKTYTILCIDDEPDVLELLNRILAQDGYHILLAENAQDGLDIMQNTEIDIVLCDYYMPEMSGTQFLAEVRHKWPGAVRIMITGYADFEAAVQAINECKVYRMILKPWNNQQFKVTIKEAIQFKKLLNNLLEQVRDRELLLVNL